MNASSIPDGTFLLTEEERKKMVETEAYEQGTTVAQIFSGIFFTGVTAWLSVSNGTRLAFVQRAALEKRLTTCCFLNIYVGAFSSFFNYFQLTAVDDLVLPESGNFTMDLARPFEWIMTCPLMQLSLVLMGGAKLPEYRRYLMPGFSVCILVLGTFGAFFGATIFAIKIACWLFGCILFGVMVWFNRMQIIEYSSGQEGLISGDSEFRKATLLLITTWSPFPIWYVLSPEGLTLLENPLIIQVGWAFLNIVAKFSFIFYIQRIKDMYCNRLKTKREMQPAKAGHGANGGFRSGQMSPPLDGDFSGAVGGYMTAAELEIEDQAKKKAQLSAVVVETMNFLGMAQHTDRFLKLLDSAEMHSIFEVEALTKERCIELQLPFDLISALQRRLKVWKLEMVDDAEMGLDKGEEFYIRKGADGQEGNDDAGAMIPGMIPFFDPEEQNAKLDKIEELLREKLDGLDGQQETILNESRSTGELVDKSVQGIVRQFQDAMEAMEVRLLERMECSGGRSNEVSAKDTASQRSEVRAFETRITAKLDELQTVGEQQRRHELHTLESRINANVEQHVTVLLTKLDTCYQRIDAGSQKMDICTQKVETCNAEQVAKMVESVSRFNEKFEEIFKQTSVTSDTLGKSLDAGLVKLGGQTSSILDNVEILSTSTRSSLDLLSQKTDSLQSSQTKIATTAEDGWRQRFNELENNMICREDEHEATAKRRFEELLRVAPTKKVDEIISQVSKFGDRIDQSSETLSASLTTEIQAAANRTTLKTENLQSALSRLIAEQDATTQRRSEEQTAQAQANNQIIVQRVDALDAALARRMDASSEASTTSVAGIETSLAKQFHELVQVNQSSTDKATKATAVLIDSLNSGLLKRIDDAIQKSSADAAHSGATTAERRAEKAVESLEVTNRTELHAATTQLLDRFDDLSASQARKTSEREERNMRRIEELLELTANRATQKTEDVGLDVKKELHGFAKRLNSKIPFM